jgi:peroxin-16
MASSPPRPVSRPLLCSVKHTFLIPICTVSATLNITSLYHDTLLDRVGHADPRFRPLLPAPPHTRYTRAWADRVDGYRYAARALEILRFTQLFLEMGLRRTVRPRTKWRAIVALETLKCVEQGHTIHSG